MSDNGNGAHAPEIKIESGIPLRRYRGRAEKYPFAQMKVGDSFLFPPTTGMSNAYQVAKQASQRHGVKFVSSKTPEGYRCWRTE